MKTKRRTKKDKNNRGWIRRKRGRGGRGGRDMKGGRI